MFLIYTGLVVNMRAVVQRVKKASCAVEGEIISCIEEGLLVFLGVGIDDEENDLEYIKDKIINLRIFCDECGKMNLSVIDRNFEILIISQFTLYGDARKGRRPNFSMAAEPTKALKMYEKLIYDLNSVGLKVKGGKFGEHMDIELNNDGPVTILLDSRRVF